MTLIDISRPLTHGMAVWPGDTPYQLQRTLDIEQGHTINLTTLTLSAHTGTHVDSPYHFDAAGATIEKLPLEPFWGAAQVVTLEKADGPLDLADLAGVDLSLAPRLLLHTPASHLDPNRFPEQFVYPTPALVAYLAEHDVVLFGTDAPSVDAADSKAMAGHHALKSHGIAILEGLDLSAVADGLYELVALPLKIISGDGSPVRAVLRTV